MTEPTIGYRHNPQRQLRRLARLLEKHGGLPDFGGDPYEVDHDDNERRRATAQHLVAQEFEWACSEAMKAHGGKW